MKYKITMPADDERTYKIVPPGIKKFQITDIIKQDDEKIVVVKCEVIDGDGIGLSMLHRVNLEGDFLWVTKIFLKCIGEEHNGDIEVDTDAWIGRQFIGEVKHNSSNGKEYANIKKLIYKDIDQVKLDKSDKPNTEEEIAWDSDIK